MTEIVHEDQQEQIITAGSSCELVDMFDTGKKQVSFQVEAGATLHYLCIVEKDVDVDIRIDLLGKDATAVVHGLFLATAGSDMRAKVHAHLGASHTSANLHLVTFLTDTGKANIDGGVNLHADIIKGAGHLLEENILLGDKVTIKTLPMLDVHSSDVSASHGARIQRLDAKKLFYLQSKGIPKQDAKRLMIEGYFNSLFGLFDETEELTIIKEQALEKVLIG